MSWHAGGLRGDTMGQEMRTIQPKPCTSSPPRSLFPSLSPSLFHSLTLVAPLHFSAPVNGKECVTVQRMKCCVHDVFYVGLVSSFVISGKPSRCCFCVSPSSRELVVAQSWYRWWSGGVEWCFADDGRKAILEVWERSHGGLTRRSRSGEDLKRTRNKHKGVERTLRIVVPRIMLRREELAKSTGVPGCWPVSVPRLALTRYPCTCSSWGWLYPLRLAVGSPLPSSVTEPFAVVSCLWSAQSPGESSSRRLVTFCVDQLQGGSEGVWGDGAFHHVCTPRE